MARYMLTITKTENINRYTKTLEEAKTIKEKYEKVGYTVSIWEQKGGTTKWVK